MKGYVFLLICLFGVQSFFGRTYRTETLTDRVRTLQVRPVDEWDGLPVISLDGSEAIEILFDEMSSQFRNLTYSIVHCNADWTRSDLSSIEYLQGFQNMPINDYVFSFNTTMPYTNYRMVFPNERARFRVSGNYAVEVFDSGDRDIPLLTACFSVIDPSGVAIASNVSPKTDIDFNRQHQQLSFTINSRGRQIVSPQQELKVYVTQNNRRDNMVSLVQPTTIHNGVFTYRHNRELIFEAGNEYRRFEAVTTAYNGMGIANIAFHSPFFHVTLFRDLSRANRAYFSDNDQNGRFFIRCVDCVDQDSEADYFFVHFTLDAPEPFLEKVYILSDAFYNILDSRSEMLYNAEQGAYTKTALLKQGAYNYMYLQKESGQSQGSTASLEGNYSQTENEYTIWVYYRGLGDRYDQLVGISALRSN